MSDKWSRVHWTSDPSKEMQNRSRMHEEHIFITPSGPFITCYEQLYTLLRPANPDDFRRVLAECATSEQPQFPGKVSVATRVPWSLLSKAHAHFKRVWREQLREDVLLLYFHLQKRKYKLIHPHLRFANRIAVDYDMPPTPANSVRFGSIHSHGDMEAFQSQTDHDDDSASPGVHIVLGNLNRPISSIAVYFSHGGICTKVGLSDIFEEPHYPNPPDSWLVENVPATKWVQPYTQPARNSPDQDQD